jgi:hypothetical protein
MPTKPRAGIGESRRGPDRDTESPGAGALRETIMPETRDALFVLGVGAGFFLAMYEWATMIAETMP